MRCPLALILTLLALLVQSAAPAWAAGMTAGMLDRALLADDGSAQAPCHPAAMPAAEADAGLPNPCGSNCPCADLCAGALPLSAAVAGVSSRRGASRPEVRPVPAPPRAPKPRQDRPPIQFSV